MHSPLSRGRTAELEDLELREEPRLPKKPPSTFSHILSGICGSLFAEQVLFPLDTIKVRAQTASVGLSGGFFPVILRIAREEGFFGFYGGVRGALFKEAFHSANFWLWHSIFVRHAVMKNHGSTSLLIRNLVCKQLNWLCTTPLEVLSTLNQTTPGNPGLYAVALTLFKEGGLASLYRGLPISLALAINPAIMFVLIHEQMRLITFIKEKVYGQDKSTARKHGPAAMFYCTAIAKIIATIVTYPFILAKVRIQVHGGGILDVPSVLASIVSAEGFGGLFKGIVAMTWKTVLHNGLMMSMKHYLNPVKPDTPPPSPQFQKMVPLPNFSRAVVPVEVMADKLDQIIDGLSATSLEKFRTVEHRVCRVETHIESVQHEIKGLSSDMQQVKELLLRLTAGAGGSPYAAASEINGKEPPSEQQRGGAAAAVSFG